MIDERPIETTLFRVVTFGCGVSSEPFVFKATHQQPLCREASVSFRFLGANLRRVRLERRLSQAALALLLSPRTRQTDISDIELGRLPSADAQVRQLVIQLAAALDVSENVLLRRPRRLRSAEPSATPDSATEVVSS